MKQFLLFAPAMAKIDKKALSEIKHAEKSRIAIKNMGYKDNAPPVITLIGPPGSGKSTLLESIVGNYFKKSKCNRQITMKVKNRRYTFYECPSDIEHVIDAIKISDMIIFLVNLRFGLQKDTFEAINMMNSFGVPKFFFVLTNHSEDGVTNKMVNAIETRLQKEFSFPVKFFCMKFGTTEIYDNIGSMIRHLEAMKYRPVEWKCVHPYIIIDRHIDGIGYGYVRGGPIGNEINGHIPGVGDIEISGIEGCKDPLDGKGNILHGLTHEEDENDDVSSAESLFVEMDDVKLFENDAGDLDSMDVLDEDPISSDMNDFVENSSDGSVIENNCIEESIIVSEVRAKSNEIRSLSVLKKTLRHRFKEAPSDEEDLIGKFNNSYKESTGHKPANILEEMKAKELEREKEFEDNLKLHIPGTYVKFELNVNSDSLLVIGSYLPTEGTNILLKGKITKNKWQSFDLKSNAPYFFSVGWCRFQAIPTFCKGNAFTKYCKEFSEIVFFGPSVPLGTTFFVYSYDAEYKILGTGQVLDINGNYAVKKKLKLIGHPKKIVGQNVIIQSMFSSSTEASRFLHARLNTVSGIRGLLKNTSGNDGCVRAVFEGSILMSETVFLKCFVPVNVYKYLQHTSPGGEYVRHLKDLRDEEETSKESLSISTCEDENREVRQMREVSEIKKLEKQLPFEKRQVKEIIERIELPIPPEMRITVQEKAEIERKRCEAEGAVQLHHMERQSEKKRAYEKAQLLKSEMKRKSAIDTCLQKKKHKKSRRR